MKTILVACGAGVASSVLINNALQELLRRNKLEAKVISCRISQIDRYLPTADMVITTAALQGSWSKPVVQGTALVTGIGAEKLERHILQLVQGDEMPL